MFKLKNNYHGKEKIYLAQEIKNKLEKLPEIIPQIKHYEIGINQLDDPRAYDIVVISAFENKEDFDFYRNHPEHKKTVEFILERAENSIVVDYFK
jgi:hypothetical protein